MSCDKDMDGNLREDEWSSCLGCPGTENEILRAHNRILIFCGLTRRFYLKLPWIHRDDKSTKRKKWIVLLFLLVSYIYSNQNNKLPTLISLSQLVNLADCHRPCLVYQSKRLASTLQRRYVQPITTCKKDGTCASKQCEKLWDLHQVCWWVFQSAVRTIILVILLRPSCPTLPILPRLHYTPRQNLQGNSYFIA